MNETRSGAQGVVRKATYGFCATMTAQPGKGDELASLLLAATLDENCVAYVVARSASEPEVVQLLEGWVSKEAHAANFATSQAFIARLAPLVAGEARYQDLVPVGGRFLLGAAS